MQKQFFGEIISQNKLEEYICIIAGEEGGLATK